MVGIKLDIIIVKNKLNTMAKEGKKDLAYWKANAEEDYMQVPISVLRYISELETVVKKSCIPDVGRVWTVDEIIYVLETSEDAYEHIKWFDEHGR